jgi:hypothetical protein
MILDFKSMATACMFACAAASAGAQTASGPASAQSVVVAGTRDPSSWLRAESPHFVILTDTSSSDARRFLEQLERLDALLRLYIAPIRRADAAPGQKLTLYYLDAPSDFPLFVPGAPMRAVGMYNSCTAGVLGVGVQVGPVPVLTDAQLATEPLEQGLSYLFEAYARHFLYRYTDVRAPAAVIEGMAKYFSAVRFSDAQMVVGRTPTGVGRYFALLDEGYQYEVDAADVFARAYAPVPDLDVNQRARIRQLEFEARAWTLAHYMLSTEERRARMTGFLDAVHRGQPPAQAFERSYGLRLDDVSTEMWRYRLTAKTLRVALPSLEPVPVETHVLTRAAGEFVLAEAVRAGCPATPQGQALLRSATLHAARMGNSNAARAGIARIQVEWGDDGAVAEALPVLRTAAAHDTNDADAAYWLGRAELRLAARDPAHLASARAALARANDLRPSDAAFALARLQAALLAGSEPERPAIDAVVAAWRGARDSNMLARQATLAYAWIGEPANASHLMQVLANDSRDPGSQAWAADWQARLEKGVAPAALFAEMRRLGQPGPGVREWTVDQDAVAREVEYRRGMEHLGRTISVQPLNP